MAHAAKIGGFPLLEALHQLLVGLLHRHGFQGGQLLGGDGVLVVQLHFADGPLGFKDPPGGGHMDLLEDEPQLLFHPVLDNPGNFGGLLDVLNLSVHHRPLGVLLRFHTEDLQHLPLEPAGHPDDAAGADIQDKEQILPLGFGLGRALLRLPRLSPLPAPASPFGLHARSLPVGLYLQSAFADLNLLLLQHIGA